MTEKSIVRPTLARTGPPVAVPRGWITIVLAIASWVALVLVAWGLWSFLT